MQKTMKRENVTVIAKAALTSAGQWLILLKNGGNLSAGRSRVAVTRPRGLSANKEWKEKDQNKKSI